MNHPGDLLSAYLDGEVSAEEGSAVVEHLAACESCRQDVLDLRETRDLVRSLPMLEPPRAAGRRGLVRSRRPALAWAVSGVAAAALAFGLVFAPDAPAASFDFDALRDQHVARVVVDPGISTLRGPAGSP